MLCRCRDGVVVLQGASADIKDCKIDRPFEFGIKVRRHVLLPPTGCVNTRQTGSWGGAAPVCTGNLASLVVIPLIFK